MVVLREQEMDVIRDHIHLTPKEIREILYEKIYIPHEAQGIYITISVYEIAIIQIELLQNRCNDFEKQLKLYL